jgi:tetratricopeptide (TPR) repeat protein
MDQQLSRGMENEARATQRAFVYPHTIQEASLSFARFAAKNNDVKQAMKEVDELLKDENTKIKAWYALSDGLRDGGHTKEAVAYLDKAREAIETMGKDPKKKGASDWQLTTLSSRYEQLKQYDAALKILESVKSDNKHVMTWRESHLGEIYVGKGDLKKAREHAFKARAMYPGLEYALTLIAQRLADAKKYDESWKAADEIEDPRFRFNAILHLAKALDSEGRKDDAKDYCRLCLKIVENMPEEKGFGGTSPRASMFAMLAEAHAAIDEAGARAWIEKEFSPQSQAWAWIGVGRAWNARLKTSP